MSTSWERLANEPILDIAPYQPGKPIEEVERELEIAGVIKLASNENPFPPPPGVLQAIRQVLGGLNRYPDGSGYYLRHALAKRHGVSADAIVLGNGSNELLELIARTFVRQGEEVVFPHPSFVVYPSIVQSVGGIRVVVTLKDHRIDLATMARAITPLTKLVFIANPNNPTGTIVTAEEVERFLDDVPEQRHRRLRRGLLRLRPGARFPRQPRLPPAGPAGDRAADVLEDLEPGRPARRVRDRRARLPSASSTGSASPST